MNSQLSKIDFKIVSAGLTLLIPFIGMLSYAAGVEYGREGYIKKYTSGNVKVEGYDGFGWDFDCEKHEYYFRKSSGAVKEGWFKSGVGYNEADLKRTKMSILATEMKLRAQSVCRALGHKP